mmetsp:Transcript_103873/g.325019  ORF Transcript_103873/g.325019 Transcript_103873/m.325019 type:complete len:181 (+) Transcript_103873:148-690(+)
MPAPHAMFQECEYDLEKAFDDDANQVPRAFVWVMTEANKNLVKPLEAYLPQLTKIAAMIQSPKSQLEKGLHDSVNRIIADKKDKINNLKPRPTASASSQPSSSACPSGPPPSSPSLRSFLPSGARLPTARRLSKHRSPSSRPWLVKPPRSGRSAVGRSSPVLVSCLCHGPQCDLAASSPF